MPASRDHSSRRPRRRFLGALAAAGIAAVAAWAAGLAWFATAMPTELADPGRRTDAIVVLTGGSGRLVEGAGLLARDQAKVLFVSGVSSRFEATELLRLGALTAEQIECCVVLGYDASNTRGNAAETAAWMRANGYRSLRLVTATYHMPRSLLEFRRVMPDIEIVPHPVFSEHFKQADWWRWPGSATLLATEYSKFLVALVRGGSLSASP